MMSLLLRRWFRLAAVTLFWLLVVSLMSTIPSRIVVFDEVSNVGATLEGKATANRNVVLKMHSNYRQKLKSPPRLILTNLTIPMQERSNAYMLETTNIDNSSSDDSLFFHLQQEDEFEKWALYHNKVYPSQEEKEHRFRIWVDNHYKTIEKNFRHGSCQFTNQTVFGSNIFKDLTQAEFEDIYLSSYKRSNNNNVDSRPSIRRASARNDALDPSHKINIDERVRQRIVNRRDRILQQQQQQSAIETTTTLEDADSACLWYNLPCWLQWICQSTGIQFGAVTETTMEPNMYGKSFSYPNAIDWRELGAVTNVRTQSGCGGCWAMTAVETIESATYISSGTLYDLSEAEIITCDDTSQMCTGGWPQNGFAWAKSHGGLLKAESFPYDANTLAALSEGSDSWTDDAIEDYKQEVCPADASESNDDTSGEPRYGNIKGYGYSTSRCICYTDGTGCDCDEQDEEWAVANIATRGPAVVCLDASVWKDYSGGIITKESGCTSSFKNMNHCVQVVGYKHFDEGEGNDGSNSHDGNGGSSSTGNTNGYWIIRNEWSSYWGIDGYAYVAMGENTCGILNDMMHVYF